MTIIDLATACDRLFCAERDGIEHTRPGVRVLMHQFVAGYCLVVL